MDLSLGLLYLLTFLMGLLSLAGASSPSYSSLLEEANNIFSSMQSVYQNLHQHPELKFEEHYTSAFIKSKLTALNISFTGGWGVNDLYEPAVGGTGIVAEIGTGEAPCVGLRADIDALPIEEEVEVPYKSQHPGRMHACGHDAHATMLLGAAQLLKQHEGDLKGTVRLIFQPAEEGGAGAKYMIQEGVLTKEPQVQRMFGLHVDPRMDTGTIGGTPGVAMAAADIFKITIKGKGSHAALHFIAIDPIAAASEITHGLYDIYARELFFEKDKAGVISVTQISGGTTDNVIPAEVTLLGTLRALTMKQLEYIRKRVKEVSGHIAAAYRCTAEFELLMESYPPTSNDPKVAAFFENIAAEASASGQIELRPAVMGAEDFAFFSQKVEAYFGFIGIGSGQSTGGHPATNVSNHNAHFAVDQAVFPIGAAVHVHFAFQTLAELSRQPAIESL